MTPKFHTLKVKHIQRETDDAVSVSFIVPNELIKEYEYTSGQYLTLKSMIKGEDVRRSYSLCSAPYEREWKVAVKQIENGKFSTFVNTELKEGDELEVMTPMGNFIRKTNPSDRKSYVFFAAGSGITPIISLIKQVLFDEPNSDVILFFGNRGFSTIIFREELEALKNNYMDRLNVVHVLSRETLGNKIQEGRIDAEKCATLSSLFLRNKPDEVYVCGPESMVLSVKEYFIGTGLNRENVHFELFNSEPLPKTSVETSNDEVEANVTIIMDDDEFRIKMDAKSKAILDEAYDAGIDVPYSCKGGVCCTCKAKILEGSVRMNKNYALSEEEVEAGYILTCQSHPTSENLLISFDD